MRQLLTLAALVLSTVGALAQADGRLPGTLFCEENGPMAATRIPVSVTFEAGQARYSFPAPSPAGEPSGTPETGGGRLGQGREVVLTGTAKGRGVAYQARYAGAVSGRGGMLTGTQAGTAGGKSFTRRCQMTLGDGRG